MKDHIQAPTLSLGIDNLPEGWLDCPGLNRKETNMDCFHTIMKRFSRDRDFSLKNMEEQGNDQECILWNTASPEECVRGKLKDITFEKGGAFVLRFDYIEE